MMPLTSSSTDKAIYSLLEDIAKEYRPDSTNSKPMHKIEQLFVDTLSNPIIRTQIGILILKNLRNYE